MPFALSEGTGRDGEGSTDVNLWWWPFRFWRSPTAKVAVLVSIVRVLSLIRQAAFTPIHLRQSVRIATSLPPILWSHVTAQERVESNSESKLVRKIDVDENV